MKIKRQQWLVQAVNMTESKLDPYQLHGYHCIPPHCSSSQVRSCSCPCLQFVAVEGFVTSFLDVWPSLRRPWVREGFVGFLCLVQCIIAFPMLTNVSKGRKVTCNYLWIVWNERVLALSVVSYSSIALRAKDYHV